MRVTEAQALRITVAYADIFDYPLDDKELRYWCVYRVLPKRYKTRNVKRRVVHSRNKWEIARHVARRLGIVPTIELVGVTGALAMDNTAKRDDIDFLIITKPQTLWTTRLLITILLDLISLRRRPGDTEYKDKICLNMFMSTSALALPRKERDLFTSHEVLQMKPLWDRDGTYQKFLKANSWVEKFLPTAWHEKHQVPSTKHQKNSFLEFVIWCLRFAESPAKAIQLWYMRKRRTSEVVSDTLIRFHPVDARKWIYRELQRRLRHTNIPLDKIFYAR